MYLVSVHVYYPPVPLTWHFVQCVLKMHNHETLLNSTKPYVTDIYIQRNVQLFDEYLKLLLVTYMYVNLNKLYDS